MKYIFKLITLSFLAYLLSFGIYAADTEPTARGIYFQNDLTDQNVDVVVFNPLNGICLGISHGLGMVCWHSNNVAKNGGQAGPYIPGSWAGTEFQVMYFVAGTDNEIILCKSIKVGHTYGILVDPSNPDNIICVEIN